MSLTVAGRGDLGESLRPELEKDGTDTVAVRSTGKVGIEQLLRHLESLPAQQSVAMRILFVTNDDRASGKDLAAAVSADPAITFKLMKLANSAYYGLSGRVNSAAFAVSVLGFSTVRALAASEAAGISEDGAVPTGFWERASLVGVAAGILAPRCGAQRNDAFSVGLLHDIGRALLHKADASAYAAVEEAVADGKARWVAEREVFGIDHAYVASRVLAAWRFPASFCDAIAQHHQPSEDNAPLTKVLCGALALARVMDPTGDPAHREEQRFALVGAKVDADSVESLAAAAAREAESLARSIGS